MKAPILGATYVIFAACSALASQDSIGPNGINSAVLNLNGNGVPIGQVEDYRPGKPGLDSSTLIHNDVVPLAVFVQDMSATMDAGIHPTIAHALEVAGVMISDHSTATGVAPNALLFASAFPATPTEDQILNTLQHVALQRDITRSCG